MGHASVRCGPGRWVLVLLLAAVVGGLAMPAPAWGLVPVAAGQPDAGVAVGASGVDAMAPSRAAGRLVAEPSVLCVHGPGAGLPFGAAPSGISPAELAVVVRGYQAPAPVTLRAHRQTVGLRAPPYRQTDL